jgi:hypothetical protein
MDGGEKAMNRYYESLGRFKAELRPIAKKMEPSKQRTDTACAAYCHAEEAVLDQVTISDERAKALIDALKNLHEAAAAQAQLWHEYVSTLAAYKLLVAHAFERDKKP